MSIRSVALLGLALLISGCAARTQRPADGPGAPAASAAVDRFLQLAAAQNYVEMGWVFGTQQGPVIKQWSRPEVEKRMHAIADVLEHDSYVVGNGSVVPGRIGYATAFRVTLQRGSRSFEVPVVTVRGQGDRWYVERVDLEAVTNVR